MCLKENMKHIGQVSPDTTPSCNIMLPDWKLLRPLLCVIAEAVVWRFKCGVKGCPNPHLEDCKFNWPTGTLVTADIAKLSVEGTPLRLYYEEHGFAPLLVRRHITKWEKEFFPMVKDTPTARTTRATYGSNVRRLVWQHYRVFHPNEVQNPSITCHHHKLRVVSDEMILIACVELC
jgi:hypothetical protein